MLLPHLFSRRLFLRGCAATSLYTAGHLWQWTPQADAELGPSGGPPEKLLAKTFTSLVPSLLSRGSWHPYPKAGESGWEKVPAEIRSAEIARADSENNDAWPQMLATFELEYKRNGNRSHFEAISFGRRTRLGELIVAECLTNQGKYLDEIANGLWLICEESFWGVPAHLGTQRAGEGLADVSEPIIDLFAAETCATLGWAVYLLGKQLNTVSPLLVKRIELEAKRRVLDPYLLRSDFSWMGLSARHRKLNNWNPWINSNILTSTLLFEDDMQRRANTVSKACTSLDEFLMDYSPDAACEEGPGYWSRSAASYFDSCWTLVSAHGGEGGAVLKHPFVRAMGDYICNVHIAGNNYVNYGDAHLHDQPSPSLAFRYGSATEDPMLTAFGAYLAKDHPTADKPSTFSAQILADRSSVPSLSRTLTRVTSAEAIAHAPAHDSLPQDAWYPHLGLMTARQKNNSAEGLYLACQAASNGRSHGHNDSGSFIVFLDGKPVFIDTGSGTYTATTFSKDRYTLWPMQSAFHNLPTVGGFMQHDGEPYRATNLQYSNSAEETRFQANLATAYTHDAGIVEWLRTLTLDRERGVIAIVEDFRLQKTSEVTLNFMTAAKPALMSNSLTIGAARLTFDTNELTSTIETIPLTDSTLMSSWGNEIYRVKLASKTAVMHAKWHLAISRG